MEAIANAGLPTLHSVSRKPPKRQRSEAIAIYKIETRQNTKLQFTYAAPALTVHQLR